MLVDVQDTLVSYCEPPVLHIQFGSLQTGFSTTSVKRRLVWRRQDFGWGVVVGMLFFCFCTTFLPSRQCWSTHFFFLLFATLASCVHAHAHRYTSQRCTTPGYYYCWCTCYCRGCWKCCCSWWCCCDGCDEFFRWRIFPRLPTAWGATGHAAKTTARRAHGVRHSFRSQIPTQARVFRTARSVFSPFITNTHSTQRRNPFSTTPLAFP